MKRAIHIIAGCLAGLIIGLGLASCVVVAQADDAPVTPFSAEISHRKILDATCFYFETRTTHEIIALSCVKD